MSDQPSLTPPEIPDEHTEKWEQTVLESARHFAYPPTPDIAGAVRARLQHAARRGARHTLRMVAAALLAFIVVTLAVPQTRAFVLEVLRIGVVRIFYGEPTGTPTLSITGTRTPRPTALPPHTPVASALDLPGETTLANAEQQLGSPILLPAYPAALGTPDHVYAQLIGRGVVVTLVWVKPDAPTQTDLLLQMLNPDTVAAKYFPWEAGNEKAVLVNGRRAYWLTGVHRLYFYETEGDISRVVDKDVLLWDEGDLTYRLETDLPLEEAIRVAESLR
ncbi:MAG: DUF4367 domain-containing protein [Anaerolineae bacterium]|nr:DUF4367 domain-containing protein [Anaerolineae bacterium]